MTRPQVSNMDFFKVLISSLQAIDWGTLKPRRANSLQFPITSDVAKSDVDDDAEEGIIASNDAKMSKELRRQSLPAFR